MKITKEQINKGRKKMNAQELQEHMKHMRCASSVHKNGKKYTRKVKHKDKGGWQDEQTT